jgi:WD40 repeat protein
VPAGTNTSRNYSISDEILSCRYSPNNTYAIGDDDGKVHYFHANNSNAWIYTYTWGGSAPKVSGVVFSPDGSVMATVWSGG